MHLPTLMGIAVALSFAPGACPPNTADCSPLGNVQFVCDQAGPEDLEVVPGGDWVIAAGFTVGAGSIRLINTHDYTTTVLYPTDAPKVRLDTKTYDTCPGPMDPREKGLRVHGIHLQAGRNAVHTLYVVHHGAREAIEVFEFDARSQAPFLAWIGCAIPPYPVGLNSVVALPEGGFAATNFHPRDNPDLATRMTNGQKNGELWEWHTATGWTIIPGTQSSGANGLAISRDGTMLYIAGWGDQTFTRVSRGQTHIRRDTVPVGFRVDNLRWMGDRILAAGQGGAAPDATSVVVKIDPATLGVEPLINYKDNDMWRVGTTAVQVAQELWVGAAGGERIARFALFVEPGS